MTWAEEILDRWPVVSGDRWLERRDPADTDELVARAPAMGPEDVAGALERAQRGASEWRSRTILARGEALRAASEIIRGCAEELAVLITRENGKTLAESRVEVGFTAGCLEYFAGLARNPSGAMLPDRRPGATSWYVTEPLGTVAIITPWNDPLATPARKLAPALLAGNAVLFKPARETPLSSLHLISALHDGGVPTDALQLIIGRSGEVAGPLVESSQVRAISFTGSTEVGLGLDRRLGGTTTRFQGEMGGKNATLVMPDADLDLAVQTALGSACGQGGQRCTATSRVIVHREVAEPLTEALVQAARAMRVGPGLSESSDMGALVTDGHLGSVLEAVERARSAGAEIVAGGERLTDDGRERGHFMAPTVLAGVTPDMEIWRQEIFGPVVSVAVADSLERGIELTNDSMYGLASAIFTQDLGAAHRFIDAVDTGQVAVNLPTGGWDMHVPFGGFKESGSAFKENGTEGLRFYSRIKSVALKY